MPIDVISGYEEARLTRLGTELDSNGLNLLPGVPDQGLVAGWINGTSLEPLDPGAYQGIVDTRLATSLRWIDPDSRATEAPYALAATSVNGQPGLVPQLAGRQPGISAGAAIPASRSAAS